MKREISTTNDVLINRGVFIKSMLFSAGGFHLIDKTPEQIEEISVRLKEMDVKQIAPSHCTGDKAIELFRTTWQDRFVEFNIGDKLNL